MTEVLVRSDIWTLEDAGPWHPVTEAFARAIQIMQARDPSDPTSLQHQASIHGSSTGDWREQCQHRSWYFLPWHRMYLHWFEQIVRAAVREIGDVDPHLAETWALPYWNYGRGDRFATLPAAFREPTLADGTTENPLFLPGRNAFVNDGEPLPPAATDASVALDRDAFSLPPATGGFGGGATGLNHFSEDPAARGGALEQTPHNDVHVMVGGLMAGFDTAGLDPVFWMHHANIDRLWAVWAGQPGRDTPDDSRWTDQRFRFPDADGNPAELACADVRDTESVLGYTYEDTAMADAAAPQRRRTGMTADRPPEHPPELVGASADRIELAGDETSVAFPVAEAGGPARRGITGDLSSERVLLAVEGIEGERVPDVPYGVYLNLPDADGDAVPERHHVGNVSFFGIEKAGDVESDGAHGLDYTFDVTDVVADLREQGRWDPEQVRVTFAPLVRVERRGVAGEAAPPPVRIGRVGLYVQ